MVIKLDADNRKFIEIEVEGNENLKYYELNTRQENETKELINSENVTRNEVNNLHDKHFWENLKGEKKVIEKLKSHYEENGNIRNLISESDELLGKL